ncbi:MAG: ThuA domain-containing protein [Planctomycetota bacterium]|nr:ThuA domain-containing protein [Planctomycetota bacterium]
MKRIAYLGLVVGLVMVSNLWAAQKSAEPTAAEVGKMEAAAPKEARVKPEKKRKLLVYSVSWGYWHDSIPYGKKVVQILGGKTGAFETIVSDDPRMFEAEMLKQFDAVLFNNTNNEIFLPEDIAKLDAAERAKALDQDARLKKSLVVFLQQGGGLAVIHAGVASFREWPEFGNIIGARFTNHPWVSGSTVTLKVDEPGHALAGAFKEGTFTIRDEIYQVGDPYSREKLRVLLSIDTVKTNMKVQGIERKDGDFAMGWIKSYGKGRVFYNALGHDHDIFWNPVVLQHWLDGLQFVLGDLKADMKPSR